jgi:hypothetical protein
MNRCRRISSTRSPGSSSTTVIAQRRIRNTYWVKRTWFGSSTSARLTRTCGVSSTSRSPRISHA